MAPMEGEGSYVFESTRATDVRSGSPCVVETTCGRIRAGHVIVATQLPFLDRGIFFPKAHPTTSYAIGRPSTTALLRAGLTHGADGYRRVTGQDAGPCAQVRGTYLVAQRRDCGHQIERCASGLLSVVLGRRQRSPNGHNRIANDFSTVPPYSSISRWADVELAR